MKSRSHDHTSMSRPSRHSVHRTIASAGRDARARNALRPDRRSSTRCARRRLTLRERLASGAVAAVTVTEAVASIELGAEARLRAAMRPSLVRVINATGVILHTNMGRAPLSAAAVARMAISPAGTAISNTTSSGARADAATHTRERAAHASHRRRKRAGRQQQRRGHAADARRARERPRGHVSRGELVEIGGGFRVPDVMAQSGAILREVGHDQPDARRRLRRGDRRADRADSARPSIQLQHPGLRRTSGARRAGCDRTHARRAGCRGPRAAAGWIARAIGDLEPLQDEPVVSDSLAAGSRCRVLQRRQADGGPQAGIIAGRAALLERIRRHPLMRALRVDKLTYAALEATLEDYAIGRGTPCRSCRC